MPVEQQIIWQPQPGPQTDLVTCPIFEVFYGGARGGGKTDGSIGDWISHSFQYGENAIGLFVRRRLTQLSEAIARAKFLCLKLGGKWYEQKKELVMPNGARLRFAYLERDTDAEEYQGHNYTRLYIEEVTNFPFPDPIMKLKGTLRSTAGVPCGIRLTGNPGGPGHHWVKDRYIDPCPTGYLVIREEEEIELEPGVTVMAFIERVFIPAKLKDNRKLLEADPSYVMRLRQTGSETLVKAWLEGDWSGVDGTFFSEFLEEKHVISGNLVIPAHVARFRALDWGSSAPFSVGFYAVSDGSFGFTKDAIIKYSEWYGWTGKPNVGLKMSANLVAQGVKVRERDLGGKISYGVADPSIFANNGGPSIAEMMIVEGCSWIRGDNARQPGWEQMRKRFSTGSSAEETLLLFHESCEQTIRTIPYLQHAEKNAEDLDTDAEDHCFPSFTEVRTAMGIEQIGNMVEGKVPTLFGEQRYKQMKTGTQVQLVELRYADGSCTLCTPSHKFLTPSGWVQAKDLEGLDICLQSYFPQNNKNSLGLFTIAVGLTISEKVNDFIGQFGKRVTGLSQRVSMSITRTGILAIIPWRTLSACRHSATSLTTQSKIQLQLLRKPNQPRLIGMGQSKAVNGIKDTMKSTVERLWPQNKRSETASSAKNSSSPKGVSPTNFAQTTANQSIVVRQGLTTLHEIVANAARYFTRTNTVEPRSVLRIVAVSQSPKKLDVFCLKVPKASHFFLANGAIVSNCADETRYAVMSRPITRFEKKLSSQGIHPDARGYPTINELIARQTKRNHESHTRY